MVRCLRTVLDIWYVHIECSHNIYGKYVLICERDSYPMFLMIAFRCATTMLEMLEMLDVLMMSSLMVMMRICSRGYRGFIYSWEF